MNLVFMGMHRPCQDSHSIPDIRAYDTGNQQEAYASVPSCTCLSSNGRSLCVPQNLPYYHDSLITDMLL